jgi:hypothetical protein
MRRASLGSVQCSFTVASLQDPRSGNAANTDSATTAWASQFGFGRRKRLHKEGYASLQLRCGWGASLQHRFLLAVEGTMSPSIQVVLNFVAGLLSDFFGLGERHQGEYPSRHGILLALVFLVILGLVGLIICGGLAYR